MEGVFMPKEKFSQSTAIQFGWKVTKENFWFFVGIILITGIIGFVYNYFQPRANEEYTLPLVVTILITALYIFIQTVIKMGIIKISLKFTDGKKAEYADLINTYKLFWRYFFSSVLYALIVTAGLLLLIIPGIIWAIRYQFFGYFVLDEGAGPFEAIAKSGDITRGAWWDLLFFWTAKFVINLVGFFALLIGLFWSYPTTLVADAHVYRQLRQSTK